MAKLTQEYGWVHEADLYPLGSALTQDAPAGTTVLHVADTADFDDDGGVVLLGEAQLIYTRVDDDALTITLADPLEEDQAALDGDPVYLWDDYYNRVHAEKRALVEVVGEHDDDPISAPVAQSLVDRLPNGDRGGRGETVLLELYGDTYRVIDVIGRTPVVDGGYTDPDTLPDDEAEWPGPPDDDNPPEYSPTPDVLGGIGSVFFVRWNQPPNAEVLGYRIYCADHQGVETIPANLAADVTGGSIVVLRSLPDGSPFETEKDYWFVMVAYDDDGEAPPGGEVKGQSVSPIDQAWYDALHAELDGVFPIDSTQISDNAIKTPHLDAGAVRADKISANAIKSFHIEAGTMKADHFSSNTIVATLMGAEFIYAEHIDTEQIEARHIRSHTIRADHIRADALNGWVFTAPVIRTSPYYVSSVWLDPDGLKAYDNQGNSVLHVRTDASSSRDVLKVRGGVAFEASPYGNSRVFFDEFTTLNIEGDFVVGPGITFTVRRDVYINADMLIEHDLRVKGNFTNPSSRRHKRNIIDLAVDPEALLALQPREFITDAEDGEPRWRVGFIAEEAADLGLEGWITRDDDGEPDGFAYASWVVALQQIARHQQKQLRDQESLVETLAERVAALEARLEAAGG